MKSQKVIPINVVTPFPKINTYPKERAFKSGYIKMDKDTLNKVLFHYCDVKGFPIKEIRSRDYGRFYKRINELLERTDGNAEEVNRGIDWMDKKFGDELSWTLETLDKYWLEYRAVKKKKVNNDADATDELLRKMGAIK